MLLMRCRPHSDFTQRQGRFGRDVRGADGSTDDVRMAMQIEEARFERLGYEIDADAVAAAIVSRLLAGGALPPAAGAPATDRSAPRVIRTAF